MWFLTPPAVHFSLQPPCMSRNVLLSSGAEQGDEVAVLNGCQEEHKTSSAKVPHAHACTVTAPVYLSTTPLSITNLSYSIIMPCVPPFLCLFSVLFYFFSCIFWIWSLFSSLPSSPSPPPPVHPRSQPQGGQRSPEPPTGRPSAGKPELPVWHAPGKREED